MSNSSTILEWLNENALRDYPLVANSPYSITTGSTTIYIKPLILDACLFYSSVPSSVTLNTIITTTALSINITGQPVFTIPNYLTATYPYYVRNSSNSLLVVGDATHISNNLTFNVNAVFEPTTLIEIYPNTLGLTNLNINGNNLTGNVSLSDGYQLTLLPEKQELSIEVGRNEGHPLPCINIKGVVNDCSSIVSTVNGASPSNTGNPIYIKAGNHFKVYDDINNSRVYIGLDFNITDILPTTLPNPPTI
jgi:hypothetical protein